MKPMICRPVALYQGIIDWVQYMLLKDGHLLINTTILITKCREFRSVKLDIMKVGLAT